VVVARLDIVRITVFEPEADPPLVVHRNGMLPGAIALEGMEAIARRYAKVSYLDGRVDGLQLAKRSAGDARRHLACATSAEEFLSHSVGEGLDHAEM
jgi:hypothetical protein